MVAERLARHHTPFNLINELRHRVEAAWTSAPIHATQSLFDSMPRSIHAVITIRDDFYGYVTVGCKRVRRTDMVDRIHVSAPLHSGQSAKRTLLGLPLTQNHRSLRRQLCDERRMWVAEWNEIAFTDEPRSCLQHHDGRIRNWRHRGKRMLNNCRMHRHTGPAPGIMVRGGIGYHSRTPLVRIAGTLNSQRYISKVLEAVVLP
ncbi:transposable element Tcb1 transposase [Trichonephila clavipes]|nr:transposable element Tcb1 transposase [Trichonephila clavipes]